MRRHLVKKAEYYGFTSESDRNVTLKHRRAEGIIYKWTKIANITQRSIKTRYSSGPLSSVTLLPLGIRHGEFQYVQHAYSVRFGPGRSWDTRHKVNKAIKW